MKISIAIPTYNSSRYLSDNLGNLINVNSISEIVVRDDKSSSDEEKKIQEIIKNFQKKIDCEIKFFSNDKNVGAFRNKLNVVSDCKNEYIYQIDSDNVCRNNFDKFFKNFTNSNLESEKLYIPSKIYQFRKYKNLSKFASIFNDKFKVVYSKKDFTFTLKTIKNEINNLEHNLINKNIRWVLNSGNFIVNKKAFISNMEEGLSFDDKILSVDAFVISYLWLKNDGKIHLTDGLYHFHRKRFDSVSFEYKNYFDEAVNYLESKINEIK